MAISKVRSAPCNNPGRNTLYVSCVASMPVAVNAATRMPTGVPIPICRSEEKRAAPSSHPAVGSPLFAGAEVCGRLVRQVVLAEAELFDQGDVLGRADELLQLRVKRLLEIGVLLAKTEAAMALDRL